MEGRWGGREVGEKERFLVDVEEMCFRREELKVPVGTSRMSLKCGSALQEGVCTQDVEMSVTRLAVTVETVRRSKTPERL